MIQPTLSQILVFQTKVETAADLSRLAAILNDVPGITKWNLDRHDVDKVLRVISDELNPDDVVQLLNSNGIFCQELPD